MKTTRQLLSVVLICISLLTVSFQPIHALSEAQEPFIYDGTYLAVIGNNSPYFSAFIEKILIPYQLAVHGDYEDAKNEFDKCIDFIEYELEYFTEYHETFAEDISSHSSEILKVMQFYVNSMFAQSELMLNTLAEYINSIQEPDNAEKCKKLEKTFLNTRDSLEQSIYNYQYLRDQITVAFVFVYAHPDATVSDYKDYVLKTYKKPLSDSYDPYTFYSKNKAKLDQEYSFDHIPEIIILDQNIEEPLSDQSADTIEEPESVITEGSEIANAENNVFQTKPISVLIGSLDLTTAGVAKEDQYKEGTLKVGVDIPEGEYIVISSTSRLAYVCVSKDSNKNTILENEAFYGCHYISVLNGQYLQITNGTAIPANKYNVELINYIDIAEGMFKVGTDIPAGEYKLTSTNSKIKGYYCVYNKSSADRNIISNDNFNGSSYVTVNVGEYLLISNCTATLTETTYDYSKSSSTQKNNKVQNTNEEQKEKDSITVYWVPDGKVYHKSKDCPTLDRSKNIRSGLIEKSPKSSCCKVCG